MILHIISGCDQSTEVKAPSEIKQPLEKLIITVSLMLPYCIFQLDSKWHRHGFTYFVNPFTVAFSPFESPYNRGTTQT